MVGDHHHFENTTGTTDNDIHTSPGNLTLTSSATFTSSEWKDCRSAVSNGGGAIYCVIPSLSISVDSCTFTDCCCGSLSSCGGSIYVAPVASFSLLQSLFDYTTDTQNACHGGTLYVGSTISVCIHSDTFRRCNGTTSGGAVWIGYCSEATRSSTIFENCIFIGCEGAGGHGGGPCLDNNYQFANFISNCLFTENSNLYGGGLYLRYPSDTFSSERHCILFCFFHKNSAKSHTRDAFLDGCPQNGPNPITHSLTTTAVEHTVLPIHWDSERKQDDWLLLALSMYILVNSRQ